MLTNSLAESDALQVVKTQTSGDGSPEAHKFSELAPREQKLATGGTVFLHPCEVCGAPNASYGYGVALKRGKLGRWRCHAHRIAEPVTIEGTARPKPAAVEPLPPPQTGDLF